ncbi:MAG: class I SAM-dependent methyltransferase [Candidatus Hodarchaeota archaeon]
MDPELQVFAIQLMKKILPEVEGIVETYVGDPKEGFSAYLDFIMKMKPSLEKIILKGLRDPVEAGHISSRLLRDPIETAHVIQERSDEEKEAHTVGYLKAILQLVYCCTKGLEGWQFSDTLLFKKSLTIGNIGKINIIPQLTQIIKLEIREVDAPVQIESDTKEKRRLRESFEDIQESSTREQREEAHHYLYQMINDENVAVPFTSRLMAYYRSQEYKCDSPLIKDPFAERLAGDLDEFANKHKFIVQRGDYPLVRSYFIENNLLSTWCNKNEESQIVLLGVGLDTRAYRLDVLKTNKHTIFELDYSTIIKYKEMVLKDEEPLCDLVRVSEDLSNPDWDLSLIENGFSTNIPSFWILEGLVYYMEQESVVSLLQKAARISTETSQIFVDICVPVLAELVFGPFTPYFKWGLEKKAVPSFFASSGWKVSCSFADDHDKGRDVGQRGLIFVSGVRNPVL